MTDFGRSIFTALSGQGFSMEGINAPILVGLRKINLFPKGVLEKITVLFNKIFFHRRFSLSQEDTDQRQNHPAKECDEGIQSPEIQQADDHEKIRRFKAGEEILKSCRRESHENF